MLATGINPFAPWITGFPPGPNTSCTGSGPLGPWTTGVAPTPFGPGRIWTTTPPAAEDEAGEGAPVAEGTGPAPDPEAMTEGVGFTLMLTLVVAMEEAAEAMAVGRGPVPVSVGTLVPDWAAVRATALAARRIPNDVLIVNFGVCV